MPSVTLQAVSTPATPPDGLLIDKLQAAGVLRRLAIRGDHYAKLHLANGDGWLALFSTASGHPDLPWAGPSALYLYRLADGIYCQVGFKPNIPSGLHNRLGAYLGQAHGLRTPIALTHGDPVKVYGLSPSCRVDEADLSALEPA